MRTLTKRVPMIVLLLGCFLVFSGCLKTRIVTNQDDSVEQAELPWAHGFVNGLVPPINAPLNAESTCNGAGVSEVYFRQTFVQGIAQGLTSSLYTPQRFTATCAQGGETASAQLPPASLLKEAPTQPDETAEPVSRSTSTK